MRLSLGLCFQPRQFRFYLIMAGILVVLLNGILFSNHFVMKSTPLNSHPFMNVTEAMEFGKGLSQASCQEATVCLLVIDNPFMDDKKFSSQSSRCFDEVIYTIASAVHEMGGKSCVRRYTTINPSFGQCRSAKRKILFGFNILKLFPTPAIVPPDFIIYNLEQVGDSQWFTSELVMLLKTHRIWDYSPKNIEALSKMNIQADYVPIGFAKGLMVMDKKQPAHSQDIDVLIVGTCNPRRCSVIKELNKRGMRALIAGDGDDCVDCTGFRLPPVYSTQRNELISRAKIVLNVHFFPGNLKVFEIVRVSFLLANQKFVISETGSDNRMEAEMGDGVVFVSYENLVDACEEYIKQADRRNAIAQKGFEVISKRSITPYLRCPLFAESSKEKLLAVASTNNNPVLLSAFSAEVNPPRCFRVLAIIAAFNEGDIIESTLIDLIDQGCDVHYIDNWSSDSTSRVLHQLRLKYPDQLTIEVYPKSDPAQYNWKDILMRKEVVANAASADWVIHIDADELRESPWGRDISLRQAFFIADKMGYNMINFGTLAIFHPVEGAPEYQSGQDLKQGSFSYFTINSFAGDNVQIKAWKTYKIRGCNDDKSQAKPAFIDLATTGGHIANYVVPAANVDNAYLPESKIFPLNFILRHYPIRSESHGKRKVFKERKNRFNATERQMDWHVQYDNILENKTSFLVNKKQLIRTSIRGALPAQHYSSILPCLP